MPSEYKHKPWERYFPQIPPLLTWMKPHNIRKAKSWKYTGAVWSLLLGTTLLYLTDWNPLSLILSKSKSDGVTTDSTSTDPSDNSLYQKVAYGGGFYKFIRPNGRNSPIDDSSKSKINEGENIKKVDKSNVKPQKVKNLMDTNHNVLMYHNKHIINNTEVSKLETPTESKTIENTPDVQNRCDSHRSSTRMLKITIETVNE